VCPLCSQHVGALSCRVQQALCAATQGGASVARRDNCPPNGGRYAVAIYPHGLAYAMAGLSTESPKGIIGLGMIETVARGRVGSRSMERTVVIIGAGPAGLSATYEFTSNGIQPIVLEQADKVGGIARTEVFQGYRFDIGGHRFFSREESVHRLWEELLGPDFLRVPRLSRISYDGHLLNYPLEFPNALSHLGIVESTRILLSYLKARVLPHEDDTTFEGWVSNRLGRRLFESFFRSYTEKVWGIPCSEIEADWATQRIQGLSLRTALSNALFGTGGADTLISEFHYPLLGPGMMWERFRDVVEARGAQIMLHTRAVRLEMEGSRVQHVKAQNDAHTYEISADSFVSSMPLSELLASINPSPPEEVLEASQQLRYRAFLLVGLILDRADVFPDHWIYVHDPDLKVGRLQNFKNWSAAMVPDPSKTSLGMEYFCDEGDELWSMPDHQLVDLAKNELVRLGFAESHQVGQGVVYRQPKAYPVYDRGYRERLKVIWRYLDTVENLQTIGRSGTHRYNNMDHSMLTGIAAAKRLLARTAENTS
jgi:protoporphyrinogen oxidase